ncbi:MFS transporter [Sphingomonas sp. RB1R13]|uniref:MFS transporter n=1 Tax=Sphingomonas sp. RB1R13 TaxID=3096159 RepID=UPI002FC771D9
MTIVLGLPRSGVRWAILAMLFGSTVLNYLDRQALSILASTVQRDLGITDIGYAHVVQLFLAAYTLAYLLAGRITDRLGSRLALGLFVAWWSIANMLTGLVRNAAELGASRFALGLGEAGNYTVGPKLVAELFEPRERGLALGIYTAGAMVGATLAPPLIGGIALTFGWRAAFMATGAAGLVWLLGWMFVSRGLLKVVPGAERLESEPALWREILTDPTIWLLALSRAIADPVWYFYLFWFPKYLTDERSMALSAVAASAWLVYLAADLGSVGGGMISSRLVSRGTAPEKSRIMAMAMAAAIAPVGALAATHPALPTLYLIASTVAFAHLVFQINISTLIVDIYPQRRVATVFGVIAAGSGLGGLLSTQAVGMLVTSGNFDRAFTLMALLHPLAWIVAFFAFRLAGRRVTALENS